MRDSILRTAGALVLLVFYAWAVFTPSEGAGPSADELRALADESRTLYLAERYAEALAPTVILHDAYPANLVYLKQLATIYGELERPREAAEAWESFVASSPTPQEACPLMGDAYFRQGLVEKSVEAFERCLSYEPGNADGIFYLARAHLRGGRLREAREAAAALIAATPDNVDALLIVGLAYQREGNLVEARKALERGVQLKSDYNGFDTALGLIAETEGRIDDAKAYYTKALALEPDDGDAQARLRWATARLLTP